MRILHVNISYLYVLLALLAVGCADVRFEKSPYAIRGLDVVYSKQEDLTFLVWRLREGIDPDRVTFDLWKDGRWQAIDLQKTPFPATPYGCDKGYICFQYQLPGKHDWGEETPLRSIQEEQGIFAGSTPRYYEAPQTFTIEPIAIDRNDTIDPRRFDWFAESEIPLRREYQWQLVRGIRPNFRPLNIDDPQCAPPSSSWGTMGTNVSPNPSWTDEPVCMVARPKRQDTPGIEVTAAFPPSAVLWAEEQIYEPVEERPPAIYLSLVDLLIRSESRCERARNTILDRIDRRLARSDEPTVSLGSFTPVDIMTGAPLDGCSQRSAQDYPTRQMVAAIKAAAGQLAPQNVRVVLVYLNNVELPPSERILLRLAELAAEIERIPNAFPYTLAIGSNLIIDSGVPWSYTIGWRPIDDKVFLEDIDGWGQNTIPFRTMLHDFQTEVVINKPVPAKRPEFFKVCAITPSTLRTITSGQFTGRSRDILYSWPKDGTLPYYTINLSNQVLVPFSEYTRQPVSMVVETCEEFCDLPFRAQSGQDYISWTAFQRQCQWSE